MIRTIHFDKFDRNGWPSPNDLAPFFLARKGREWSFEGGNDSWGMTIDGLYETARLSEIDRVTVRLHMLGNRELGVVLMYDRWDGRVRRKQSMNSKGDLTRLREFVRSLHGDPLSVGLFIPFRTAWPAVKEFMDTNGELPRSIEWIATSDLPPETFPDP